MITEHVLYTHTKAVLHDMVGMNNISFIIIVQKVL